MPTIEGHSAVERPRSPAFETAGGTAAFLISLAGFALLRLEAARAWGFGLVAGGAVLGAVVLRGGIASAMDKAPTQDPSPAAPSLSAWAGVGLAAACLAAADWRRFRDPSPTFGATEGLWVLSILLLAISAKQIGAPREAGEGPRWSNNEIAIAAAVLLAGLAFRVVHLRDIPFAIQSDEILTGRIAREYFFPWRGTTLFRTVWKTIDLPALWFAIVATSLKTFGTTLEALRLPAALFGAAVLVPFFMLAQDLYGRRTALLATALLAASSVNIHLARITVNNLTASFFWTLCFALLLRGLRSGSPFLWAAAGLAGGLGEHFYYGTRLLPFILILFLTYLFVVHRGHASSIARRAPLLVLGYLAGLGPLLSTFLHKPGLYLGRGMGVLAVGQIPMSFRDVAKMFHVLGPRLLVNALGIATIPGDAYAFYTAPLLTIVEAALLALGVALLLRRWRNPAAFLLIVSVAGVVFVGGTLVPPQPAFIHWTPALASFYAILAAPLSGILAAGDRLRPAARRAVVMTLVFLVAATCAVSLDFYFRRYVSLRPELDVRAAQARFQAALGTAYRVRGVGHTWQPYDRETTSYLIKGQDGAQIRDPDRELPLPEVPGRGLAFFFFQDNEKWLPRVRALHPGGRELEISTLTGIHLFIAYLVPGADLPPGLAKLDRIVIRPLPGMRPGKT